MNDEKLQADEKPAGAASVLSAGFGGLTFERRQR